MFSHRAATGLVVAGWCAVLGAACASNDAEDNCGVPDCPTGYVDCMPPVAPEREQLCSATCAVWMTDNCPDAKYVF
jgi:hypothetical protein